MIKGNITSKQIIDMSTRLKAKNPHWLTLIAKGISKEKDWKMVKEKDCTEENARHISTGKTKSQFHRRLFMKIAAKILVEVKEETEVINELLEKTV